MSTIRSLKHHGLLLPLAALVALAASCGWFIARVLTVFPDDLPVPAAAPKPADRTGSTARLQIHHDLLAGIADAQAIEIPYLQDGSTEVNRQYGHLHALTGVLPPAEPYRSLVVTVPLGARPGSDDELNHESRHALYLPAPARISWNLVLPDDARLQMAVATLPVSGQKQNGRLTVRVKPVGRDAAPINATFSLEPPAIDAESGILQQPWWTNQQVDLSTMSGKEVVLELFTSSSDSSQAAAPNDSILHVLVGNPVIVGSGPDRTSRKPNLLWINIDTVQAAVTGIGGDSRRTTPELDRLAAQGVTFSRVFAASNWTRPANLAFFTGLHPSEAGMKVDMIPVLPEEQRSYYLSGITALPLHLHRQGYRTRAVVQNNMLEDFWHTGVDVGFAEYRYVQDTLEHSNTITGDAIRFMQDHRQESWFLYLGYNAPHWPYRPPRKHLAKVGMADDPPSDWLMSLYRGEVSLSDAHIAPLIESLKNLGLDRDTLVVINSDHGEQLVFAHAQEIVRASLWEEGQATHERTFPGHETLFNDTVHVPLVLWWPGRLPGGRKIDLPLGLVDIPPTILELMDLAPLPDIRGRSAVNSIEGGQQESRPILIEGKSLTAVIDWPLKYIRRDSDNGKDWIRRLADRGALRRVPEELYDLDRDPGELDDLAVSHPEELGRMRELLAGMRPEKRYLYFIETRGGNRQGQAGMRLRLRFTPQTAIADLQLLSAETDDALRPGQSASEVWLQLHHGDHDRIVLRTRSTKEPVMVEILQDPSPDAVEATASVHPAPIFLGQWSLPTDRTNIALSGAVEQTELDSTIDPAGKAQGIYIWRIPITGGIEGRGGKVAASMQKTFQGWGYAK